MNHEDLITELSEIYGTPDVESCFSTAWRAVPFAANNGVLAESRGSYDLQNGTIMVHHMAGATRLSVRKGEGYPSLYLDVSACSAALIFQILQDFARAADVAEMLEQEEADREYEDLRQAEDDGYRSLREG